MSAPHPIREEDLELLALGVLGGEECQDMRAHLASCAECSQRLAEARGRVAMFSLAAPQQAPPLAIRERLLSKLRFESASDQASVATATDSRRTSAARWWSSLWIPATAVLALATILLWVNDRHMSDQLQRMRDAEQMFENHMHHEQALVSILSAADTKTASLAPNAKAAKWWADVKYNTRLGMVCYNGDLPAPPPDKEYQMWIVPMVGSPISAGAFMPTSFSNGRMCVSKMPEGISCKSFAVTVEPKGGMAQPTGPMILTGDGF